MNVESLVPSFWSLYQEHLIDSAAWLGDWMWYVVYDCVVILINRSLSRKREETGMVRVVRNHVVSDHCEATAWNEKLHSTLWIRCVTNATKYSFLQSVSVKFYYKQTIIFIKFHFKRLKK